MAQLAQLAGPVMRRRAGFHADQTRRQAGKERNDLATSQAFDYDRCARLIDAMT